MTKQEYSNYQISAKDQLVIDAQLDNLQTHFRDIHDELPLVDIVLTRGKRPGSFLGSVAVFLLDASFHTSAQRTTPSKAIKSAFTKMENEIAKHERSKRYRPHMTNRRNKENLHHKDLIIGIT